MHTLNIEIIKLSTDDLEQYIDDRYEAKAPQEELEALEMLYSSRVSEDDLNMTEDEPNISEEIGPNGGNLELGLMEMYHRYLQPDDKRDGAMTKEEVIGNMRANLEDASLTSGRLKDVTDTQVLSAAKDVYEYKRGLIARYKSNKLNINLKH